MKTAALTRNPEVPPARWPFQPSIKKPGDIVLGSAEAALGSHDRFCRCRVCKEPLI